jgi:hypothetical protein
MRAMRRSLGALGVACCAAVTAFCLVAGPVQAATDVYPPGRGTFTGGAQGWKATEASCNTQVSCTASGGYDGSAGNPPGSIAANTNITLGLAGLFKSTVTLQSPDFTVSSAGDATLHLERQFVQGSLVDLAPQATYVVNLLDRTAGTKSEILKENIAVDSAFTGKDNAATVKAGHTYALSVTTETSSTVAGTGAVGGTTSVRFDNVSLSVELASGTGKGSGSGGNLTNSELRSLFSTKGSLIGPAVLKGKRLFVKARCPAKVGRACRISLQGLLKKRKPATSKRTAKVGKGKTKRFVLKVKPKARKKLAKRKRLLFKQTVRAGKAKATVYKRLKLIRRR